MAYARREHKLAKLLRGKFREPPQAGPTAACGIWLRHRLASRSGRISAIPIAPPTSMMTPQIMKPVLKPCERGRRPLDDAAHDVGRQEPGRGADRGADGEQRAALSDGCDFADDGVANHVDDRRQRHPDRRQADLERDAGYVRHDRQRRTAECHAGTAEEAARHPARHPAARQALRIPAGGDHQNRADPRRQRA